MLTDLIVTTNEIIDKNMNNKWEQYLSYIKRTSKYEDITLETAEAFANEFDLYAILTKMGIPERYHYPIMRLNNYKSPTDFDGTNKKLKIYPSSTLDGIYVKIISN